MTNVFAKLLNGLLTLSFASSLAVVAQLGLVGEAAAAEDKVVYKKRTLVDFSDVSIQGELRKPEGDFYGSRKRTRFNKLIRARANFNQEIKASADDI